jgi:hypothetical protein
MCHSHYWGRVGHGLTPQSDPSRTPGNAGRAPQPALASQAQRHDRLAGHGRLRCARCGEHDQDGCNLFHLELLSA